MGKLYVVRHADAGHRSAHRGPDESRPLSERGLRQAEGVAEQLGDEGITHLVASPYLRCIQTLEPLAKRLSLTVADDPRLAEGEGAVGALLMAADVRHTSAAFCSHGDVIPDLLDALVAQGLKLKDELRWQKASTWVLTWDGDRLSKGRYLPPPG